ncbi:hypothetical protein Tco_0939314 [Tanacetum coccineum]|uniref:Uncharacterized protein n=1 Tax=Tanacetum coccineum TaxID=301880 RepID=A0ABQ5DQV4_9ASTR
MYRFLTTLFKVVLIYLALLIYEVTLSNPYSAATHFRGVTNWYLEPRGINEGSHIALSPGYIADSDPEEDEEDPADHPAYGGDNDDNESSDNDDDDDDVRRIRRTRRRRNT